MLRSLFRKGQIKLFLPSTLQIKTIPEHFKLPNSSKLLIPNYAVPAQPSQPVPNVNTEAAQAIAKQLQHSVLYRDEELLVINKPQNLPVQGGSRILLSLDQVMQTALKFDSTDAPRYSSGRFCLTLSPVSLPPVFVSVCVILWLLICRFGLLCLAICSITC